MKFSGNIQFYKDMCTQCAEYTDQLEYGQEVDVYIRRIIPEKKKIKLVITNN